MNCPICHKELAVYKNFSYICDKEESHKFNYYSRYHDNQYHSYCKFNKHELWVYDDRVYFTEINEDASKDFFIKIPKFKIKDFFIDPEKLENYINKMKVFI